MDKYWIYVTLISLLSCTEPKEIRDKTIIPVAEAVGTGEILNLSDYAKSVKYISLETTDSLLIGDIDGLVYENGRIALYDFQGKKARLFQEGGKYITDLGRIGHGPGEYSFIRKIHSMPDRDGIFLATNGGYFIYDLKGRFVRYIPLANAPAPFFAPGTIPITDNFFLSFLVAMNDVRYKAMVWGQKDSSQVYDLIPYHTGWDYKEKLSSYSVSINHWRFKDQVRCFWAATDTVFTIGPELQMEKAFVIDLEKYKQPLKWLLGGAPWKEVEVSKTIKPWVTAESSHFLFIALNMYALAPEPFTYKRMNPRGYMQVLKSVSVFALFNKDTGKLVLMNQPVKHKYLGFRNDLDGGPAFWPKYISSKDEMVTWFMAEEFLEIYGQLPNPSPELKAVAEKLTSDDNPVLMVVQLK